MTLSMFDQKLFKLACECGKITEEVLSNLDNALIFTCPACGFIGRRGLGAKDWRPAAKHRLPEGSRASRERHGARRRLRFGGWHVDPLKARTKRPWDLAAGHALGHDACDPTEV